MTAPVTAPVPARLPERSNGYAGGAATAPGQLPEEPRRTPPPPWQSPDWGTPPWAQEYGSTYRGEPAPYEDEEPAATPPSGPSGPPGSAGPRRRRATVIDLSGTSPTHTPFG